MLIILKIEIFVFVYFLELYRSYWGFENATKIYRACMRLINQWGSTSLRWHIINNSDVELRKTFLNVIHFGFISLSYFVNSEKEKKTILNFSKKFQFRAVNFRLFLIILKKKLKVFVYLRELWQRLWWFKIVT